LAGEVNRDHFLPRSDALYLGPSALETPELPLAKHAETARFQRASCKALAAALPGCLPLALGV
jgi:hypothetical protein